MPDNGPPHSDEKTLKELEFHYEKGNHFRVIHVDGGHGGISPDGDSIILSIYSERLPIPKREVFAVDDEGKLAPAAITKEGRKGLFREIEATLVMSPRTAESIRVWLAKYLIKHREVAEEKEKLLAAMKRKDEE